MSAGKLFQIVWRQMQDEVDGMTEEADSTSKVMHVEKSGW